MPIPEPPEQSLRAIGRISVNFAELERLIRVAIAVLLGSDYDRGFVATAEMQWQQLENLFVRLYERRLGLNTSSLSSQERQNLERFSAMIVRMHKAAEDRNRVLHSSWYPQGDSDRVVGQRWGKRGSKWYQPETEVRSGDELNEMANRISGATQELEAFIEPFAIEMDRHRGSLSL